MKTGAERQSAYRARRLGAKGDGVRVDLIVSTYTAVALKRLARCHRVTEAVALTMALKLAEADALARMAPRDRAEYRKAVRVGGASIVG